MGSVGFVPSSVVFAVDSCIHPRSLGTTYLECVRVAGTEVQR